MTRIVDGTKAGHASWSHEYAIGVHNCTACKVETPGPPQRVLDDLAALRSSISTVWPFEHWQPNGWMDIRDYGHICPACSRAVMDLLGQRSRLASSIADCDPIRDDNVDRSIARDLKLLESNFALALALVSEGLRADFPPPPEVSGDVQYRYKSPGGNAFMSIADYNMGALRERIRAIGNALRGKPLRSW